MGPVAGEFHEAFELGDDPETIGHVDVDGVALAAIQGLTERLDPKIDRIDELEAENDALRDRVAAIEDRISPDGTDGQQTPADD